MPDAFIHAVAALLQKAPDAWLDDAFNKLCSQAPTASADFVAQRMPMTHNADLSFLMAEVLRQGAPLMSWEAIAWAIKTSQAIKLQNQQKIELLWSGPDPAHHVSARRIDQALYDHIHSARREILLVTFAATKISRLTDGLMSAAQRGVTIRLILEFEQTSEGQLSFDALHAFPPELKTAAKVFCWPTEKRQRNERGRPGKLHAKLAVIDDVALIFSANLTDDAFNRNLELGVCLHSTQVRKNIVEHFDALIEAHVLVELP